MALIRYPGSKQRLAQQIRNAFPDEMRLALWADAAKWEYREPFFGAGAIGFEVLSVIPPESRVVLNDKDYGISCMWNTVLRTPKELVELIRGFAPSADSFYEFKEQDGRTDMDPVRTGFQKLALHQMSVSGFGVMSGGPLGGKDQENATYRVDCRWNPERLVQHTLYCHRIFRKFKRIEFRCCDFAEILHGAGPHSFVYLDPPYVEKGGILYKHNMCEEDHRRLASMLRGARFHWALSYDDHALVRELYEWADINAVHVTYTTATLHRGESKRPKNREVVVTPRTAG